MCVCVSTADGMLRKEIQRGYKKNKGNKSNHATSHRYEMVHKGKNCKDSSAKLQLVSPIPSFEEGKLPRLYTFVNTDFSQYIKHLKTCPSHSTQH